MVRDCMHQSLLVLIMLLATACAGVDPGSRSLELAGALDGSELAERLQSCSAGPFKATRFSIAHRGAPLGYPEHTAEGYIAAARMGAGIIECDVTFTADQQLVCRHSQCDLHRTTNILRTPLASTCAEPFTPAGTDRSATARCCTSDLTLAQFRTLCGRRDLVDTSATSLTQYLIEPPSPVIDNPMTCARLLTHAESITLIDSLGADFTPELKSPQVAMPFNNELTQTAYAAKMLDEYRQAGIDPARVFPQSFNIGDVLYWLDNHPEYAEQVVWLDPRGRQPNFEASLEDFQRLKQRGVRIVAPPIPMLVQTDARGELQATPYARFARQAGLQIITWTFEAGVANDPNNWMYRHLNGYVNSEGKMLEVLHFLQDQVGIAGIFSDWPGTVTYYANCMGLD